MRIPTLSVCVVALALALSAGPAAAAATIVEQTPQRYTLTVRLGIGGHGRFALTCPSDRVTRTRRLRR